MSDKVELIVECLRRYKAHRDRPRPAPAEPLQAIAWTDDPMPPGAIVAERMKDPVRTALRGIVRDAGWRAYIRGGVEEMHRVAQAVEDGMSEAPTFAGSILDKWWDGIGGGDAGTWTA